jgi:hypothetical protein
VLVCRDPCPCPCPALCLVDPVLDLDLDPARGRGDVVKAARVRDPTGVGGAVFRFPMTARSFL